MVATYHSYHQQKKNLVLKKNDLGTSEHYYATSNQVPLTYVKGKK